MFYLKSKSGSYSKTFGYRIYSGSASGPGTLLASGTSTLRTEGWHIIDFSSLGVTISSADFFIAIVLPDDDLSWGVIIRSRSRREAGNGMDMPGWLQMDYL